MLRKVQARGLAAILGSALLFFSCSGSSSPAGGPIQSQQASTASLQGQYALMNSSMVGSLNFDGQGNVSGEIQFFDSGFSGLVRVLVSGTYRVGPDGRGTTSLKGSPASSRNPAFSFVVLANGDVMFTETDLQSSDGGIMKRQDPSSFSFGALNATYSFGPLPVSSQMLCGTGVLTIDQLGNVTFNGRTFAAASIDSVTGNIDVSQASGSGDALYAVSSNEIFAQLFVGSSFDGPAGCQVERSTGSFSNAASAQDYTLLLPTSTQIPPEEGPLGNTGATFSVANGAVQSGTIDQLGFLDGAPVQQINQPIASGAFAVNPDGSCSLSCTNLSATCFAVSPDFAFLQAVARNLTDPELPVLIPGLMTKRQTSSLAPNSLIGDFGVVVSGVRRDNALLGSVALLTFDGSGSASGMQDSNAGPGFVQSDVRLQGTYTIAPNGRGIMMLSSPVQTSHYALYLASGSEFYLVGLDADVVTGFGRK
jgi:hypothetical protein